MTTGGAVLGKQSAYLPYVIPGRRDPAWSTQQPYTLEDVATGFHDFVAQPQKQSMTGKHAVALVVMMAIFPAIVVATLVLLCILMGLGLDSMWSGINEENPAVISGALIIVFVSFLFLSRLLFRLTLDIRRRAIALPLEQREFGVLYRFVEQIATLLNGPVPTTIKVDNEVGLLLRKKRRMGRQEVELMIGLPLFHSLSARQLSGLIAHTYGGFSRVNANYGYPFIANLNRWLVRLSDADASRSFDQSIPRPLFMLFQPVDWVLTQFFIALSRGAEFMSFSVSRQMDLQGDAYSARLGGATEFRATQIRLRALRLGKSRVSESLAANPDAVYLNIARIIADEADHLQLELRAELVREMEDLVSPDSRSRVVDLGRIIEVEKSQDEGACFLLGAAVRLLPQADSVAQRLERLHRGSQA